MSVIKSSIFFLKHKLTPSHFHAWSLFLLNKIGGTKATLYRPSPPKLEQDKIPFQIIIGSKLSFNQSQPSLLLCKKYHTLWSIPFK